MNLAYVLRGELVTLLNKRLMTDDQLNLDMREGVGRSLPMSSLLTKKPDQPNYEVVGLLCTFFDSSFKSFGQGRAYANNLIRLPFFSNGEWGFAF